VSRAILRNLAIRFELTYFGIVVPYQLSIYKYYKIIYFERAENAWTAINK